MVTSLSASSHLATAPRVPPAWSPISSSRESPVPYVRSFRPGRGKMAGAPSHERGTLDCTDSGKHLNSRAEAPSPNSRAELDCPQNSTRLRDEANSRTNRTELVKRTALRTALVSETKQTAERTELNWSREPPSEQPRTSTAPENFHARTNRETTRQPLPPSFPRFGF